MYRNMALKADTNVMIKTRKAQRSPNLREKALIILRKIADFIIMILMSSKKFVCPFMDL